jgi:hypothetical protein
MFPGTMFFPVADIYGTKIDDQQVDIFQYEVVFCLCGECRFDQQWLLDTSI